MSNSSDMDIINQNVQMEIKYRVLKDYLYFKNKYPALKHIFKSRFKIFTDEDVMKMSVQDYYLMIGFLFSIENQFIDNATLDTQIDYLLRKIGYNIILEKRGIKSTDLRVFEEYEQVQKLVQESFNL